MKSLLDFILESKGADLKDRKWSRFFGDEYGKDVNLKKQEWRAKKFLKDYKENISEKAYDFLSKLATNRKSESFEYRSYFGASFFEKWNEYEFNFNITANNIPDAIGKKLHPSVVAKKFNLELKKQVGLRNDRAGNYSCDGSSFGTADSLSINFHEEDKDKFFEIFNYVADTLAEIGDDILSYEDDYKDKEIIDDKRRKENKK